MNHGRLFYASKFDSVLIELRVVQGVPMKFGVEFGVGRMTVNSMSPLGMKHGFKPKTAYLKLELRIIQAVP